MKIVIKIGSSVLTGANGNFPVNKRILYSIVSQASQLVKAGHRVAIVTSGAVASCRRKYSKSLRAAVGQPRLMKLYSDAFDVHGLEACQLLFTHADLKGEKNEYTKKILSEALKNKVVPVINANDGVNSEELDALREYADNDVLASHIAVNIGADILVILIKEPGLMDYKGKKIVPNVTNFRKALKLVEGKSQAGTGGMASKIKVAKFLKERGVETRLIPGRAKDCLVRSIKGEPVGTSFG